LQIPTFDRIIVLAFTLLVDLIFGEYPSLIHPVVYMGFVGKFFDKKFNQRSKSKVMKFALGSLAEIIEIFSWLLVTLFIYRLIKFNWILKCLFEVFLLKAMFSIRGLYEHVNKCCTEDENELRHAVSMIVSRDTSSLDKAHLYSAAIESLSENTSDSITGPLLYYVLFGLPGAMIYRIVNTYDALFGYRNERYEWFGKFPARFDDVLNLLPARFTAIVISFFDFSKSWEYIKKYGRIKINATYPMSAFAGVLNVGFEKIGYYKFDGKLPDVKDVKRALSLYIKVVSLMIILLFSLLLIVILLLN